MNRALLMVTICLLLLAAFRPMSASAQQKCLDSIIATSPDSSFIVHKDGTAIQKTTGLMWMRCNLGLKWDGTTCHGTVAGLTWREALNAAVLNKFAGYSDWRLPNKNELESILEERCASPSINTKVFPATPPTFHWASTPYAGLTTGAWSVDFGFGVITATDKTGKIAVRVVRDAD